MSGERKAVGVAAQMLCGKDLGKFVATERFDGRLRKIVAVGNTVIVSLELAPDVTGATDWQQVHLKTNTRVQVSR